ncbi:MAG: serine/threonine protein kinase [Myxococcales bacterium]|nr:serine/threonine protein kinase [Myxococcales bacterium]
MEPADYTGRLLGGRYVIGALLGVGGFGGVYAGQHSVTERDVAIKLLWPDFAQAPDFRKRFVRECRLAARVGSEYVVDVLDAGFDEHLGQPFLVMERLRGENLGERLIRKGRFSAEQTSFYLGCAAAALERTHQKHVVHGDLKPGNLFLTTRPGGTPIVKVLDFGVAKLVGPTGLANSSHSMGTPLFMAPEQLRGGASSAAADIYALGQVAYSMLVGGEYFRAEQQACGSVVELVERLQGGVREKAGTRAALRGVELPQAFDDWFAGMTALDPGLRPSDSRCAILELAELLGVDPPRPLAPLRTEAALAVSWDEEERSQSRGEPVQPISEETARVTVELPDDGTALSPANARRTRQ